MIFSCIKKKRIVFGVLNFIAKYPKNLMKTKKNIVLIGMPAVGKSTIGNLLAQKIDFDFLDSDDLIQSKEQKTLSQIILEKGLDQFLQIEESHIVSIRCKNHVIATGGSVVYSKKAMEHLSKFSTIIYLSIPLDILLKRFSDMTSRGVAVRPGQRIEDLYKERTPLYDTYCDIKIDCLSMTAEQVVEQTMASLF
jgi:shikimate kinase